MANDTNKIKLLVLWDILCKNTDENHAMNSDEIREELAKRGISVMRKVVATDIAALNKYGYEVLSYKKKYYYYYVVSRPLETAEVVMLADVIKASKLTSTQKNIMIEKLSGTLCSHQAENLSKHIISLDKSRKGSSSLIYNVDAIERGIEENKQISFLYFDYDEKHKKVYRKNGDRYMVNPAFMVWNRDNYYMLCFSNGHDDMVTYRLDKMENVKVEEAEREPHPEYELFNTEEYRKQVFSMFGGETQKVTLLFTPKILSDMFDRYSYDVTEGAEVDFSDIAKGAVVSNTKKWTSTISVKNYAKDAERTTIDMLEYGRIIKAEYVDEKGIEVRPSEYLNVRNISCDENGYTYDFVNIAGVPVLPGLNFLSVENDFQTMTAKFIYKKVFEPQLFIEYLDPNGRTLQNSVTLNLDYDAETETYTYAVMPEELIGDYRFVQAEGPLSGTIKKSEVTEENQVIALKLMYAYRYGEYDEYFTRVDEADGSFAGLRLDKSMEGALYFGIKSGVELPDGFNNAVTEFKLSDTIHDKEHGGLLIQYSTIGYVDYIANVTIRKAYIKELDYDKENEFIDRLGNSDDNDVADDEPAYIDKSGSKV